MREFRENVTYKASDRDILDINERSRIRSKRGTKKVSPP